MEDFDPGIDAAWQAEVARRWKEIQDGRAVLVPWEVVKERILKDLARARENLPPKKDQP